jgi:type I restriction enzyme, S subunit
MTAKAKSKPASEPDITPDELPEGWAAATLKYCSTLITKGSTPTSYGFAYKTSGINFIRVENLANGRIDRSSISVFIDKNADAALKRSRLQAGDLLYSIAGTIGRTGLVTPEDLPANTNQALAIIRGTDQIFEPSYLRFALASSVVQRQSNEDARGGGMNNISLADVNSILLPISPVPEQHRIVAKIEDLFQNVNASRERLAKVPKILKAFRQSVLAAACSGRLTEEWREKHPDFKTGKQLLTELLGERRRQWIEHQGTRKYSDPIEIAAEDLEDIPETWVWASVDSLSTKVVDGVHKTPEYVPSGIPFVTVRNLTAGPGIDFESLHFVTNTDHEQFIQRANPERGDLLVSKDGTLGVVRAIRTDKVFSIFVSVALIKPVSKSLTNYLDVALSSPSVQAQMVGTGSGLQHIHLRDLRADGVPLPPLEEQREIVRRVEILFKLADKIERRVEAATKRADKLTQSILAKAFRGELVPTEAELARKEGRDYEPASALLERIKSDRAKSAAASPNGTGRRRRSAKPRKV